jgi:CRP-like cAMP-binding protein
MRHYASATRTTKTRSFQEYLDSIGATRRSVAYLRGDAIFTQGDDCNDVGYITSGTVKLAVLSPVGKEAVVAMLGPGDFLGEACLAGQPKHLCSAIATTPSALLVIAKHHMLTLLHEHHAMSDRFIAHMLARNLRVEEDLVDHLFNSSEKRLARTLMLLARYGQQDASERLVGRISQETLAEMVGTTRSRVNFFLNKFKKLGFIEYESGRALKINDSLFTVVLHD